MLASQEMDFLCAALRPCRTESDATRCLRTRGQRLRQRGKGNTSGRRWINFLSKIVWSEDIVVMSSAKWSNRESVCHSLIDGIRAKLGFVKV